MGLPHSNKLVTKQNFLRIEIKQEFYKKGQKTSAGWLVT